MRGAGCAALALAVAAALGATSAGGLGPVASAGARAPGRPYAPPGARPSGPFAPPGAPGTTSWASPIARAALQGHPWASAPRIGRLHLFTEDGFPEVDLVTREAITATGARWLRVEQPAKPHAVAGWVPARLMTPLTQVHTRLVVDRARRRATLYRDGRVVWRAPVGVGKPSTPTPPGHYWVREKFPVPGDGLYGTRAFGTSDYSPYETDWPGGGIVGIHGTDEPGLIPGDPSHGCIRVRNADVERLYRLMAVGTPVLIR